MKDEINMINIITIHVNYYYFTSTTITTTADLRYSGYLEHSNDKFIFLKYQCTDMTSAPYGQSWENVRY